MDFLKRLDKRVFYPSALICLVFILWMAAMPEAAGKSINAALNFINTTFGWLYLLLVSIFVLVCFILAFGKYGKIKLGKDDDEPEYSTFSWFAMLFSAAMGIGLIFWSIAEPMSYLVAPPVGEPNTAATAQWSLRQTIFHWGLHPWSVYAITGMALAYAGFRKDLPARISSIFEPVLGRNNLDGGWAKAIDVFAVIASIAGVATSLGFGAMQINGGLNYLAGIPVNNSVTVVIIAVVTCLFIISAVTGIKRGILWLSNINMSLMGIMMVFLLVAGPTLYILNSIVSATGDYLQNIAWLSFYADPNGVYAKQAGYDWVGGWTVFYWAWWISWGPFVGGFIARISKGRTVREFVLGVLIAPVLLSILWLGIFGSTAIHIDLFGAGGIGEAVSKDMTSALFITLSNIPGGHVFAIVATALIATFFITSADSATFCIGMYSSGGSLEPDNGLKVFWGVIEGAVTAALVASGGIAALKASSILSAFPFMLIICGIIYCMFKSFNEEFAPPKKLAKDALLANREAARG
ncbi:glycine/betaine ABC transporter permease [Desulfosporosinus sp. HMP52]|uniref:BCCT family transporter n=1 Tax=Desulfosporosinus sp. HMP52 TaxID=1487923 RepID=UPI00051FCA41|nr:BCCT family transporter [Desulfosporosinus sp. HMP52]KGK81131.1 glycine/betaine ABC transporter permease [Desulfosporosinus sp. HMP52]